MHLQLVCSIGIQIRSDINTELKITTSVESRLLAIDEDSGLVIDSAKVQNDTVAAWPS